MLKLSKISTITRKVALQFDDAEPASFQVRFHILPKHDLEALMEEGASDRDYLRKIVADVSDLTNDAGQAVSGDAALKEVLDGRLSLYLQRAILDDFFEHIGDVRVKNSRPSRGR